MELSKKLKEKGWCLTSDGLKKVSGDLSTTPIKDVGAIIASIMDMDLRDIAGGALPTKRDDYIPGRIVLQLQKSRNISAPKSNEESKVAPRFLQLELTDGLTTIQALELENIPSLSMNIPPGTKLYFCAERLQLLQGFLVLRAAELQVLGGHVDALVEKWELARTMQKYARSGHRISGVMGPPPWIPFGKKVDVPLANERNFKSLQPGGLDGKESKENEEFNAMRNEAIAEATKAGAKKVFGGGGQQMIDHNIKKILEKGYSEEDAKYALRTTNNNLERALYNLKRRAGDKRNEDAGNYKNSVINPFASIKTTGRNIGSREIGSGKRGGLSISKEEATTAKPMSNVSLYDFLTDKLSTEMPSGATPKHSAVTFPVSSIDGETTSNAVTRNKVDNSKVQSEKLANHNNLLSKFENNMSSSFAANRSTAILHPKDGSESMNNINDRTQDMNSNNSYQNKSGRVSSSQIKSSNNQNQNVRRNRQSIPERPGTSSRQGANAEENESSTFVKKRANSPKKSRGVEERYDNYTRGKDRYNSKNDAMRINKLTETASKLQISDKNDGGPVKNSRRVHNSAHNSSQHLTNSLPQNHNTPANQLPNNLRYDTSKIIGFQNKETNEIAMTLLKSQSMGTPNTLDRKLNQNLMHASHQFPSIEQFTSSYVASPVSPHMQGPAQISNTLLAPAAGYTISSPQTVPSPIPSHFGMVPGDGWHWKIGDVCFAKYWDDGRYYEAEVTAVSEKTCVVFFLGYGNHEEVLKSDCLPITDTNHCPVNNHNPHGPQQHQMASAQPYNCPQIAALQRGGGSQRLRGERQVYVPPPKRDN